eukprot:96228-Alexandrium_andersonii.AAC.1
MCARTRCPPATRAAYSLTEAGTGTEAEAETDIESRARKFCAISQMWRARAAQARMRLLCDETSELCA